MSAPVLEHALPPQLWCSKDSFPPSIHPRPISVARLQRPDLGAAGDATTRTLHVRPSAAERSATPRSSGRGAVTRDLELLQKQRGGMPVLTLQLGQCGNQLGHALFSALARDAGPGDSQYAREAADTWFRERPRGAPVARALLVDTEPKVLEDVTRRQAAPGCSWHYCGALRVASPAGGGSGNNWALGFRVRGPELGERVVEAARREAERCDPPLALLSLLSSAGGTGSGLGSHVISALRDEFPCQKLVSVVVLPYCAGEAATQDYNTVLALAALYEVCDLHLLFGNDELQGICSSQLGERNPKLVHLNRLAALQLAAVFQPVQRYSGVSNIVSHLAAHPAFRLATVGSAPHVAPAAQGHEAGCSWPILARQLRRTLRGSRQVAGLLVTRGAAPPAAGTLAELGCDQLYCGWVPREARLLHFHQPRRLLGRERTAALACNSARACRPLDSVVDRAWRAFSHGAYLHHYSQHGVGEDDFREAFLRAEAILQDYAQISE
ncbi:tubulin delta chain-like [Bacillus rossius redtenbacheri]|uniref:tubulin delta chain-like n=1 Tax=Bacillus rossius redtenbacheri TaxID=93214 RepID=UPI002FDD1BA0